MSALAQNSAKVLFPFHDESFSIDKRVDDLVSRMTLEEKINQMKYNAPAIERLGIPEYCWWNECLHGVARAGLATVFPQALNLAASWDTNLIFDVASAISDEARAKYNDFSKKGKTLIYQGLTFWSPNINIFRDPRWGRGHETFGEDPYLTGEMGLNFVKGLQGDDEKYFKVIATPKHYAVHSGPEPERHRFDARVTTKDLRETYLPAFRACIVEGKAYSIMCAYNRFMGEPCCGNNKLLNKILREEWGFSGYVVSDCWAVEDFYEHHKVSKTPEEAVALAVKNGTDLNCGDCYPKLMNAIEQNLITEKEIDVSVKRLFKARFLLGLFDTPDKVPFSNITYDVNNCKPHDDLSLEAARKSIVLLKNEGILPLNKNLKRIAVIGPNADDIDVLLGNYNGTPYSPVTIIEGIRNKVGKNTSVVYSQGCNLTDSIYQYEVIPSDCFVNNSGRDGLTGEYFDNRECDGEPVLIRDEKSINFNWWNGSPDIKLQNENFSAKYYGYLIPKETGKYHIVISSLGSGKLYFNDELVLSRKDQKTEFTLRLVAGNKYKIKYEIHGYERDAFVQLRWAMEDDLMLNKAVNIAKLSDVIIAVLGLSPRVEGEEMDISLPGFKGGDRIDIELPIQQLVLLKALHSTGIPVVLVLLNGGALALTWADENLPAIIEAGYPGQRGGNAVADVIFGDYNPAGRLPVTYYKSISQLPDFENYNMQGRTYRYFKGVPLYSFGYGLSYTKFSYSNLKLSETKIKPDENLKISVEVSNTGSIAGDEVVQLYVKELKSAYEIPVRCLQGFKRINLLPGERKTVDFVLTPGQFSVIDDENERIVEPGEFEISIGGKQPSQQGSADVKNIETISAKFKVTGNIYLIEEYR